MPELFIDTHAHLFLEDFDDDREEVINRAVENGVGKILLPNIDSQSIPKLNTVSGLYPGICHPMMGLHPTSVKANYKEELSVIESELKKGGYVGVGETGIDLYWDKSWLPEQEESFRLQIELAIHFHLPLVIHARESFREIIRILEDYSSRGARGVFHAFTGDIEIARSVIGMGFFIGIGGILTYKKSDLPLVVKEMPLECILLETDSPYLPPVPYRGKRNESSFIPVIAQYIQQLKGISLEKVAQITTRNALQLFQLNAT